MGRRYFQLFLVIVAALLSVNAFTTATAPMGDGGGSGQCGSMLYPQASAGEDDFYLKPGDIGTVIPIWRQDEGLLCPRTLQITVIAFYMNVLGAAFAMLLLWLSRRREAREIAKQGAETSADPS